MSGRWASWLLTNSVQFFRPNCSAYAPINRVPSITICPVLCRSRADPASLRACLYSGFCREVMCSNGVNSEVVPGAAEPAGPNESEVKLPAFDEHVAASVRSVLSRGGRTLLGASGYHVVSVFTTQFFRFRVAIAPTLRSPGAIDAVTCGTIR